MNTTAIICEYNPFHNGHKYQMDLIKNQRNNIICIMSGDFVQRGECAVYDKFERARAAVENGADLVIMLPVCFSVNTAERFAYGAVGLADSLGIVDSLCFGSECGDIKKLTSAAKLLVNEPFAISEKIKTNLKSGMSYPKAREAAFSQIIEPSLLSSPNDILALEYIKALLIQESKITPYCIKRHITEHNGIISESGFACASLLRSEITNGRSVDGYVPENARMIYKNLPTADISRLNGILTYIIRTLPCEELAKINDVTEGLENRITNAVLKGASGFDEIVSAVTSKRYPSSKIRRILISLLLGLTKDMSCTAPEYIRVVAMNKTGAELLSEIKKKSPLPIITKTADYKGNSESFKKDILAGDLFTLCLGKQSFGRDYKTSPYIQKLN